VLRTRFGWPDLARLGFGSRAQAASIPIGLEGDWLDCLGTLLGERGRSAVQQIALPEGTAPPNNPERLIAGTLELPNAIWRLKAVGLSSCHCLLLSFRYTAISDEKRDGLVWRGFNCTTGAVLHDERVAALRRSLDRADGWQAPTPDAIGAAGAAWPADMVAARALPIVERLVRADLAPFLMAMRRRARRDRIACTPTTRTCGTPRSPSSLAWSGLPVPAKEGDLRADDGRQLAILLAQDSHSLIEPGCKRR
jgi:hypothetical protein